MNLRTDRNFALYSINRWVFMPEVDSVYRAVRDEYSYNRDTFRLEIFNNSVCVENGFLNSQNVMNNYFHFPISMSSATSQVLLHCPKRYCG